MVHKRSYEQYHKDWNSSFERYVEQNRPRWMSPDDFETSDSYKYLETHMKWPPWRYNDIIGFVEICYDGGTRLQAFLYLAKGKRQIQRKRKVFVWYSDLAVAEQHMSLWKSKTYAELNEEIRESCLEAINAVTRYIRDKGWFIDASNEIEIASNLDFVDYLRLDKA